MRTFITNLFIANGYSIDVIHRQIQLLLCDAGNTSQYGYVYTKEAILFIMVYILVLPRGMYIDS
jgi:hypothetical protein